LAVFIFLDFTDSPLYLLLKSILLYLLYLLQLGKGTRIHLGPLFIVLLVDLSLSEQQSSESFLTPLCHTLINHFASLGILSLQAFEYNVIRPLAIDKYPLVLLQNDGHPLAVAVELYQMQYLILDDFFSSLYAQLVLTVHAKILPPTVLGHVDEGELVRRGRIVPLISFLVLLDYYVMTKAEGN
jgi:hypothetical protein